MICFYLNILWVYFLFFVALEQKIISSFHCFFIDFWSQWSLLGGTILTGFPWNLIAYSFSSQIELISIISVIGTYGFNLFCISLFTCPAILILRRSRKEIEFAFLLSRS